MTPTQQGIVDQLERQGWTLAVAESLSGGLLTDAFAKAGDAATWLRGGLVAYSTDVKRSLLGIGDAPAVSEPSARAMAANAAKLLGADVGVAVTGVGGPDPQDGVPAGTVWIGTAVDGAVAAQRFEFTGDPPQVVDATCDAAMTMLLAALRG